MAIMQQKARGGYGGTLGAIRADKDQTLDLRGTALREKRQPDEELFTSGFDRGIMFAFFFFPSPHFLSSSYSFPLKAPDTMWGCICYKEYHKHIVYTQRNSNSYLAVCPV